MAYSVEIVNAVSGKKMTTLERLPSRAKISEVKELIHAQYSSFYPGRQSIRLERKGKSLADGDSLSDLSLPTDCALYFKDLGPQVGWSTVFLAEYAGPLFIYLIFYLRPAFIYNDSSRKMSSVVHWAALCHSVHYLKRVLETLFVHRFSHSTMPLRNLFKNCTYYWGFAAFMAYFINHPLYTAPGQVQVLSGIVAFGVCELGNFSIHIALKNLRPAGSKERKVPYPTSNPLTALFNFVSCPNYTYEVGAWLSFGIMTQCLAVIIFMACGFCQMAVWAKQKHRRYKSEFKNYPRRRSAIIPFLL